MKKQNIIKELKDKMIKRNPENPEEYLSTQSAFITIEYGVYLTDTDKKELLKWWSENNPRAINNSLDNMVGEILNCKEV